MTEPPTGRAAYPHFLTLPTRWKDNDIYGHVNNVEYYSYFDSAINHYLIHAGGLDIHRGQVVGYIVESHCRYLKPVAYPEVLEVGLRVGKLGHSSIRYELGLFKAGDAEPAAEAWLVHVFVDRSEQRAHPIPEPIRAALSRLIRPEDLR